MDWISFTKVALPFGWLGNMSPYPVIYNNKEWRTTEALFQALRFDDETLQEEIRSEKSPMSAKLKAKKMVDKMVIMPLSHQDIMNMKLCVQLKIDQHSSIKEMLCKTNPLPIYEDVTKRSNKGNHLFWGAKLINGVWVGENTLGKIWMEKRTTAC